MDQPYFEDLHHYDLSAEHNRNYEIRYIANLEHLGLRKYRTIRDINEQILINKIANQFEIWDRQYAKLLANVEKEINIEEAEKLDQEAKDIQEALENILNFTLDVDDTVDWNRLKNNNEFDVVPPDRPMPPAKPKNSEYKPLPPKPNKSNFDPNFTFLENLISPLKKKKLEEARDRFDTAIDFWENECGLVKEYNDKIDNSYSLKISQYEDTLEEWQQQIANWEAQKEEFYLKRNNNNQLVDQLKEGYLKLDPNSILEYCELVLNNSDYSTFNFPKDFELDYSSENKTLLVEYALPTLEDVPSLQEVKFVSRKKEFREKHLSATAFNKLYNDVIYQIILRSIHEIYEADAVNAIESIVFNGWVNSLDKSTGLRSNICIASVHTLKEEFLKIDLSKIDHKACFKGLKGVSANKLNTITPIKPLQRIDKTDKRFVDSQDIAQDIDESQNLAMMDWEDFEHLVRELFHKEFSVNGGEVKVTQSSRDGGVDAIAFDPDPIRGGKIIIQAKRYSNLVGVGAVRDLWGTTMNEGASKGIIVTTSNYGSDAYAFAKDKPLTLINGNNLLYLLQKHGFKARINLKEAKEYLKANK